MSDRYVSMEDKRIRARRQRLITVIILWAVGLYVAVTLLAYWIAHPELSQMEVIFRIGDALIWRW